MIHVDDPWCRWSVQKIRAITQRTQIRVVVPSRPGGHRFPPVPPRRPASIAGSLISCTDSRPVIHASPYRDHSSIPRSITPLSTRRACRHTSSYARRAQLAARLTRGTNEVPPPPPPPPSPSPSPRWQHRYTAPGRVGATRHVIQFAIKTVRVTPFRIVSTATNE